MMKYNWKEITITRADGVVFKLRPDSLDPLVNATAQKLLDRMRMLPMADVLAKVPGETWVAKAKTVGVTRVTLHGWLTGRCRPYPQQAQKLAEITGFDAAAIRGTRSR